MYLSMSGVGTSGLSAFLSFKTHTTLWGGHYYCTTEKTSTEKLSDLLNVTQLAGSDGPGICSRLLDFRATLFDTQYCEVRTLWGRNLLLTSFLTCISVIKLAGVIFAKKMQIWRKIRKKKKQRWRKHDYLLCAIQGNDSLYVNSYVCLAI